MHELPPPVHPPQSDVGAISSRVSSDRKRAVRYDLRGFWRSAMPTATPYSNPSVLRHLLGIERAHIGGRSSVGGIATDFALENPLGRLPTRVC